MMRKMMVGLTLLAMLLVSGLSFAQESTVLCGGLSEADCAILQQSADAMAGVTSATFTFDFVLDAGDQGALNLAADGSFEADMAALGLDATRLTNLTYNDVLTSRYEVMDMTAFTLCQENNVPILVLNFDAENDLVNAVNGDTSVGTLVSATGTL